MVKTLVTGGHKELNAALTTILGGATPNIVFIIEATKGYWIIIHEA